MSMPGLPDTSWSGLLSGALNVGLDIYRASQEKRAMKKTIKAQAGDFPQLGMGYAASGPQRGTMQPYATPVGSIQIGPGGIYLGDSDQSQVGGNMGDTSAVGPCRPRTPSIVYGLGTTPCGNQKLIAMRSAGTPLLWSGDFAAVKRVARVARKLGRFVHHRRPR